MLGTDHAGLDRLALAADPGAGGLTLLPYLDGERTPNLPSATGSLHGLTRSNATPENLARAVVEGMLLNLAAAVDAVRAVGCPVERVLLIGGAAASSAVQEIAPDLFGVPVAVPRARGVRRRRRRPAGRLGAVRRRAPAAVGGRTSTSRSTPRTSAGAPRSGPGTTRPVAAAYPTTGGLNRSRGAARDAGAPR